MKAGLAIIPNVGGGGGGRVTGGGNPGVNGRENHDIVCYFHSRGNKC